MLVFALSLVLGAQTPHDAGRLVRVIARAIGYDQTLKQHAKDKVVIAILMSARNPDSMSYGEALFVALTELAGVRVQGIAISPDTIRFEDLAKLDAALVEQGVTALFIAPGLEKELHAIVALTRKHQIFSLSVGGAPDITLGVTELDDKIKLSVNPQAAKLEGVVFAEALLSSATIVGQ